MFVNDTSEYYEEVKDPEEGMDDEITVSHMLRLRNSFTRYGLPFGSILARNLMERGLLKEGARVLEVGPGLGDLAEQFFEEASPKEYVFIDISPKIIGYLRKRFSGKAYGFILGNFLETDLKRKFDLIICNEVLSDLPTIVNFSPRSAEIKGVYRDALRMVKKYGLKGREVFNFNYGAMRFLEVSSKILEKNGVVFISEQDSECRGGSGWPERIRVSGHNEYTIKMSWLRQVAKKLMFSVESGTLTEFLGVRKVKFVSFFTQPELRNLYESLKRKEVLPEQRALTLEEFFRINREFINVSDPKKYMEFLEKNCAPLTDITDKFSYLVLKK
ncbi:MAG: methyltransferase domain-containing protein [Candidatus Aenigmarchaeota archaeon]|nr:methyltransferase domain-containing protein [Candidatus Aenigmarchaeota archaeon]NIP40081.1 methyltransferase domain-containing protein [Candidatus Aenigmarchaeota archaeon]NIQ18158.1 methyltransferase domain-containing protein [Candidatus Aenigmarchaeota archaeon]NIS72915.1 methyltransferase domain-containing protein [Candidatus Aenigmarchaeota archaeon]